MPIVNPDGYDYTFASPDTRLWRKNLRDNNADEAITAGDGVDLNRNWADEVALRPRGRVGRPRHRDLSRHRARVRARGRRYRNPDGAAAGHVP